MTDRINSFTITLALDKDYRDDDLGDIVTALLMVKHVIDVQPNVVDVTDFVAASRVKQIVRDKLLELIKTL